MTEYIDSQGCSIKIGDGASPEVFTIIPKVTSISPLPIAAGRPYRDRTDLSNTAVRTHGFGIADMPEITLEGFFDPNDATHQALITAYTSKAVTNFKVTLSSSPIVNYDFSALVMLNSEVPLDVDMPFTVTLKPQTELVAS